VVAAIENRLAISIRPPLGIMPVAGIVIDGYALHYRRIDAIYTAGRARNLADPGMRSANDGGLGFTAPDSLRFGRNEYTRTIGQSSMLSVYSSSARSTRRRCVLKASQRRPTAYHIGSAVVVTGKSSTPSAGIVVVGGVGDAPDKTPPALWDWWHATSPAKVAA
jgi:hypothetical protein